MSLRGGPDNLENIFQDLNKTKYLLIYLFILVLKTQFKLNN